MLSCAKLVELSTLHSYLMWKLGNTREWMQKLVAEITLQGHDEYEVVEIKGAP